MHRWKLSLLAAAATLSTGLYIADASALSLGRVTVQSALGEPLRAEIALPQITAAEADSLHVTAASPEVFRAQGLEYSPTVGGIQVQLLRRANGSAVVQLSSNSPINDPFLDLVIDATWNAGHIVRSYTMLFDPPGLQQRTPVTVNAAPQVQAAPRPVAPTPAPVSTPAPAPAPAPARAASTPARSAPVRAAAAPAVAAPAAAPVARPPAQVTVRQGDTAGAIASTHRPANVSLDQMLVAMLRANPQAFIEGNVNRVRAGAVLQMPGQSDAQATPAAEARRIIAAQSRDFNEFRRRLAGTAPTAPVEAAQRSASGKVQAQVAESKPEAASVDKLTLSKGSADVAAEAKTAQVQQADENAARKAELAKNISDLKQLSESASSSTPAMPEATVPAAATTPPAQETPQTPAAAASAESSSTTATSADTPAAAEAPAAAPATAPVPTPAPTPAAAAPTSEEEPGLLESLTQDPWTAGGIVVLLLALLGWAGYRSARRRREQESPETMFASHREPGDSFFAASGGQRVDTTSNDLTTGSTLYTPSQLDTDGEIDPVAEASVYLAYGKDVEAERILNAAATRNPDHVGVQAKLAEVYAKRHDRPGLEAAARKVLDLTQGQGPDWEAVLELGRALDPDNALYQAVPPAEAPAAVSMTAPEPAPAPAEVPDMLADRDGASTGPDSLLPDIDLDLDLDPGTQQPAIDAEPTVSSPGAFATAVAAAAAQNSGLAPLEPAEPTEPATLADTLGNDVPTLPAAIWDTPPEHAPTAPEPPFAPPAEAASFSTSGLSLLDSGVAPLTSHDAKPPEPAPLDFDLGELSLDLNSASAMLAPAGNEAAVPPPAVQEPLPSDPLSTKLALAEEFKTIGDGEGARALVEEVLAEATGELRDRAQRLLATLG